MRVISFFSILITFIFCSCGGNSNGGRRIGVDANWYPLELGSRDNNVTAFSTELLTEIGKIEKIPFVKMTVNWNELMEGLQKDKYEAILSSMPPYIFNRQLFDFSDVYLPLGPVLVVPVQSSISSLNDLSGKEIAVISGSTSVLILEKNQGGIIRYYDSIPKALNDILIGTIDGAVVDILSAVAYCRDLYQRDLKVIMPPLNEEGLRLITKHGSAPDLIKGFNRGLAKMKKDSSYDTLLEKWELQVSASQKK
jgi:polar amino acid transport system substrate-binding protein